MSKNKQVPPYVELREERKWFRFNWDSIRDVDPNGEWIAYEYKRDEELESMMAEARDATEALAKWRAAVESDLYKKYGAHLIPGPLKDILGLPVRQVYLHEDAVYRIEADGRVTTRLI